MNELYRQFNYPDYLLFYSKYDKAGHPFKEWYDIATCIRFPIHDCFTLFQSNDNL